MQALMSLPVEEAQIAQDEARSEAIPFALDAADVDALIGSLAQRLNDARTIGVDIRQRPVAQQQHKRGEDHHAGGDDDREQPVAPKGAAFAQSKGEAYRHQELERAGRASGSIKIGKASNVNPRQPGG